jgi:predicted RecA/RadA family phage recombinase
MADPLSKLIHPAGERVVTASKAYISGEPLKLTDGRTAVYAALRSAASGERMAVQTDGVYKFPCATGVTFSVGATVHWDIANRTVVASPVTGSTFELGTAVVAKTSGQLSCQVDISPDSQVIGNGVVHHVRTRFTVAQINAGANLLPAVPGARYRLVDAAMIAVGGAAATATSVDLIGTQSASAVNLVAAAVAGLTQNTLLRAGATNAAILAAGASFVANDANTAISVGKTGSNVATATHVDFLVSYVLEPA